VVMAGALGEIAMSYYPPSASSCSVVAGSLRKAPEDVYRCP
jgi:hypothetical protein